MNAKVKTSKIALILFLVGLYTFIVASQTGAKEFRPYVRLGYELMLEVYQDPVISGNKIVDQGKLVNRKMAEFPVGSGTVISSEGLIITNYHVYNFPGAVEYDQQTNQLIVALPASSDMLVYELYDNDPLKAPEKKYIAEPLAYDDQLDICVLKVKCDAATGGEVRRSDFPYVKLGNPFDISFNADLTMIGYPAKGGDTLTRTRGRFLGYTKNAPGAVEGSIKTDATIAGGSSGGSALYGNKLIGLPTRVSLKAQKGFDFGYVHPVTWAAGCLAIAKMKSGVDIPEIPLDWVASDYNVDITKSHIFIGGKIYAGQSNRPVDKAAVLIYRSDRTLNQIIQLDREIEILTNIVTIQNLRKQGISKAEIAGKLQISLEQLENILSIDINKEISDDARRYVNGEFFYKIDDTDASGFFFTAVPRGNKLTFYVEKSGFRQLSKNITSGAGLYQDLGRVKIFAY